MKSFEIEQKYRCANLALLRKKLIQLKARLIKKGSEQNEFWDVDGKLARKKMVLRLRRHGKTSQLTLKGPRLKSYYTKRIELETEVDYQPTQAILKATGFQISKQYSKKREVYQLGKVIVTLDTLPRFGTFVELEGAAKDIGRAAEQLRISERDREERSYLGMLFKWRN